MNVTQALHAELTLKKSQEKQRLTSYVVQYSYQETSDTPFSNQLTYHKSGCLQWTFPMEYQNTSGQRLIRWKNK